MDDMLGTSRRNPHHFHRLRGPVEDSVSRTSPSKQGPLLRFVRLRNTVDCSLSQLVDQLRGLGYRRTLEVEFQAWALTGREAESNLELLPKFGEKDRARIIRKSAGRAVYCSNV